MLDECRVISFSLSSPCFVSGNSKKPVAEGTIIVHEIYEGKLREAANHSSVILRYTGGW